MIGPQVLYRGATEYVGGSVTANVDLVAQVVEFSFTSGVSWVAAAWSGSSVNNGDGTYTRTARLLTVVSTYYTEPGPYTVLCKVTATPEIPIFPITNVVVR